MRILVIRFRQMGDAILATPLLSTLRLNYPDAEIDFVLNERIAPLFDGHPAISRIITFSDEERHSVWQYARKVWRITHSVHYDAIIDMRSTANTMLFALFSLRSKCRIGIRKPYTWGIFNHRYEGCEDNESMISHNLRLAEPLKRNTCEAGQEAAHSQWKVCRDLTLSITGQELHDFRTYMEQQGIDFSRPIMLAGVTAKLTNKTWAEDRMTDVLRRFIAQYPDVQIIFNYAPGQEADNARHIYEMLNMPANVFINIEARSMRQLAAMAANCTFYFGNEGGGRHIVHAMGRPSFVICSPYASKSTWLPTDTSIPTAGVAASDIADTEGLSPKEQYAMVTADYVWPRLTEFVSTNLNLSFHNSTDA